MATFNQKDNKQPAGCFVLYIQMPPNAIYRFAKKAIYRFAKKAIYRFSKKSYIQICKKWVYTNQSKTAIHHKNQFFVKIYLYTKMPRAGFFFPAINHKSILWSLSNFFGVKINKKHSIYAYFSGVFVVFIQKCDKIKPTISI